MKAILIDPYTQTLNEVVYDGNYKTIQKLIGCFVFDVASLNDATGDSIYVDDSGLQNPERYFFAIYHYNGEAPTLLAGKALALGCDLRTGKSQGLVSSFDELTSRIVFISEQQALSIAKEYGL